jgi:hypothetical protein
MLTRFSGLLLPLALAVGLLAALPSRTDADCASIPMADALRSAPIVFVGTAAESHRRSATTTFLVDDIWRGPAIPPIVTLHNAASDPTAEDAPAWKDGARYVVMPQLVDEQLEARACSGSRPWTDDLAAFRPADAHPPVEVTPTSGPPGDPPYALVFLLIVAGGAAGTFLLLRRS